MVDFFIGILVFSLGFFSVCVWIFFLFPCFVLLFLLGFVCFDFGFGFFVFFIFESSALIWERETVTEGHKLCAPYLGLTGFVYLQSLVKQLACIYQVFSQR